LRVDGTTIRCANMREGLSMPRGRQCRFRAGGENERSKKNVGRRNRRFKIKPHRYGEEKRSEKRRVASKTIQWQRLRTLRTATEMFIFMRNQNRESSGPLSSKKKKKKNPHTNEIAREEGALVKITGGGPHILGNAASVGKGMWSWREDKTLCATLSVPKLWT